jgi:cyclase
MLKKRIIPCLDIKDGRTVKGINFVGIKDAGDPIELAEKYANSGADELVFLDITATQEKRKTLIDLVERVALKLDIPFTVGGGIKSVDEARFLLNAGADKVSLNSSAIKNPELIRELASQFGSQCVVLAVDVKLIGSAWKVFINGGRIETDWEVKDWVKKGVELGAGEILLTSMNNDGTKDGFALEVTNQVCSVVNVPVIASGGAGSMKDFEELFTKTKATAGLAASIFHYEEVGIPSLKEFLNEKNISVRWK